MAAGACCKDTLPRSDITCPLAFICHCLTLPLSSPAPHLFLLRLHLSSFSLYKTDTSQMKNVALLHRCFCHWFLWVQPPGSVPGRLTMGLRPRALCLPGSRWAGPLRAPTEARGWERKDWGRLSSPALPAPVCGLAVILTKATCPFTAPLHAVMTLGTRATSSCPFGPGVVNGPHGHVPDVQPPSA